MDQSEFTVRDGHRASDIGRRGWEEPPRRSQRNRRRDEAGSGIRFLGRGSEGFQEEGCRMTERTEHTPATVPLAQQAGETLAAWRWVPLCAWTIRLG